MFCFIKKYNKIIKNYKNKSDFIIDNKMVSSDGSINYIMSKKTNVNNIIECRYVRRNEDYISAYLSSHTGCIMGCKFCWLTQSKQNTFKHTNIDDYAYQLETILSNTLDPIENRKNIRININFMARGEVMANKYVLKDYKKLYDTLNNIALKYNYKSIKMNLSTIFPYTIKNYNLEDIFESRPVNIYYSLYSVNQKFRKEFIPNAIDVKMSLDKLKQFQIHHNNENTIVFHWALIKGENDNIHDVEEMANIIKSYNFINTKFNLVRLNPFIKDNKPIMLESEYSKLIKIFNIMNDCVTNKVPTQQSRIINRIGPDVYASCGMFSNTTIDLTEFNKIISEYDDN